MKFIATTTTRNSNYKVSKNWKVNLLDLFFKSLINRGKKLKKSTYFT